MAEVVGFVGLGAMGLGMASNLVSAGYQVVGYDISPDRQRLARQRGITLADSPQAVAASATGTVVSVVRTVEQTERALMGERGIVRAGKPLTVVVASTLDPETMTGLAERLAPHGVQPVDVTMSGGPWGAEDGTLTLICSGPRDAYDTIHPLLTAMGNHLFHVSSTVGTAQAVKLAVQLAFGINMLSAFEALRTVRHHGVDEEQFMEILGHSVGGSWVTANWQRITPWWKHYVPGEDPDDLEILLKDMRAMLKDADTRNLPLPVTALAFQLLRSVWNQDYA
ncbi:NAD(P)-dependent oxidoreductase [Streptomyces spiralis]|uniref:NAD(P)-dependent oxidoreductase n=1 Tax=Streptomyces spiralis TaxID=66376 RepID=UPI0036C17022